MSHELKLRQRAIRMKQAGRTVSWICHRLECSREWFYKWRDRYLSEGAAGLRDRSHAPRTCRSKLPSDIRQAILATRDQLMRRHGPRERYRLAGAPTIRHELACLGYHPLPSLRSIERVLQMGGRTSPAFHPQPREASRDYSGHHPKRSNQLHQVDLIGPRYLKGTRRQWFFLVYRDVYDGAVYVEFQPKPKLEMVLAFVVRAWQRLGLPDALQVDNSDLFGLTSHPGSLTFQVTVTSVLFHPLALAAVDELAGVNNVMLIALATDGDDGPTDAAGAVVTGQTAQRAESLGLRAADYLSRNDAYPFFYVLGDLLKTGPTGTNVNDLLFVFAF